MTYVWVLVAVMSVGPESLKTDKVGHVEASSVATVERAYSTEAQCRAQEKAFLEAAAKKIKDPEPLNRGTGCIKVMPMKTHT